MGVSSNTISIRNLIEIRPDNTIQVPGCEPISSLTSNTLAANMNCVGVVIDLAVAIEKMPGSYVVTMPNAGSLGTIRRFLVLPDGPPPSPAVCNDLDDAGNTQCRTDWYKIMKENARPITEAVDETSATVDGICSFFSLHNRSEIL